MTPQEHIRAATDLLNAEMVANRVLEQPDAKTTVSTLSEAELFANAGVGDIYMPLALPHKNLNEQRRLRRRKPCVRLAMLAPLSVSARPPLDLYRFSTASGAHSSSLDGEYSTANLYRHKGISQSVYFSAENSDFF